MEAVVSAHDEELAAARDAVDVFDLTTGAVTREAPVGGPAPQTSGPARKPPSLGARRRHRLPSTRVHRSGLKALQEMTNESHRQLKKVKTERDAEKKRADDLEERMECVARGGAQSTCFLDACRGSSTKQSACFLDARRGSSLRCATNSRTTACSSCRASTSARARPAATRSGRRTASARCVGGASRGAWSCSKGSTVWF